RRVVCFISRTRRAPGTPPFPYTTLFRSPEIVAALKAQGLLSESEGAQCVFLDSFKNKDGNVLPVIVQKADGGYLYATSDLAAMRYRQHTLNADRILYFVDQRQGLHFQQVFAVAQAAG